MQTDPLSEDPQEEDEGHENVPHEHQAAKVEVIDLRQTTCGCPGLGTCHVLDSLDIDLGHSRAYGGGYGHSMEQHLRSVNRFALFDDVISFVDETHTYYYESVAPYFSAKRRINSSTTAVISAYFEKFDEDATLVRMRKRGRMDNPDDEYYGMTDEQIKKKWKDNGENAAQTGTDMHAAIERFLNHARIEDDEHEDTRQFMMFRLWHLEVMVEQQELPFRTELCMFDEECEMAGMCDLVSQPVEWARDPLRCHWINLKDWKHTTKCNWENLPYADVSEKTLKDASRLFWNDNKKQFRYDPKKQRAFAARRAKGLCSDLVDCEASKYLVQLNVYKWMIERNSPYVVKSMQIVAFHSENDDPVVIEVPNFQTVIEKMMEARKASMLEKYADEMELLVSRIKSLQLHPTRPE